MTQTRPDGTIVEEPKVVVQRVVTEVSGTDVAPDQSFFDLGLDSIQLMDICTRINEHYGEVIDLFLLFENPTINECVAIIQGHLDA